VRALLQARTAHASLATRQFGNAIESGLNGKVMSIRLDLENVYREAGLDERQLCEKVRRTRQAPLGWYMSYGAADAIAKSAGPEVQRVLREWREME
jgi:hypothetical protein